jgi:DNA-binding response OmpR family regulator
MKILILSPANRMTRMLINSLQRADIPTDQLCQANEPGTALAALERASPSVIFADVDNTPTEGLNFIRAVRNDPQWKNIPIIAVCPLNDGSIGDLAREAGATVQIKTPFHIQEIRTRLAAANII